MTTDPTPNVAQTTTLMRVFRVCWALLMLGFLYAALPNSALAATSSCSTSSSGSLTMGNVAVPVNAANGTTLGTPVTLTMTFNCTGVPTDTSGNNLYVQAGNLAARDPADTGANGILFDTSIAGIALKITGSPDQASASACLRCGPNSTAGFEIGALNRTCTGSGNNRRCTATITQTFTAQFVKTGAVTPGTVQGLQLMQFWWYEYGTTASSGPMGTAVTLNGGAQVTSVGCTVDTGSQNMTVTLPAVTTAALQTQGATAGRTRFNINLTCQSGTTASITFAATNPFNNPTGIIAPTTGTGFAANIGIQLLNGSASAPVPFTVAQSLGTTPNGAWSVPFHVQYYRTSSSTISAGDVRGTLTFTMTYQ
ncbi:fimbrial protein [Lysobacter soli]|uniref:Type 1 fimbrial protein n=1 Tax=Lysobacter soli TaxID=453783 RepID=A0A3D8VAV5_9GAMM|nr:fimbrial protein [Lysobacter soli]RDY66389.1 type 1 fimbrial protein [Lysobacter soli]